VHATIERPCSLTLHAIVSVGQVDRHGKVQ